MATKWTMGGRWPGGVVHAVKRFGGKDIHSLCGLVLKDPTRATLVSAERMTCGKCKFLVFAYPDGNLDGTLPTNALAAGKFDTDKK